MNDWVFCNKCSQKFESNLKFFLSECGHIFCERCAKGFKQSSCSFCSKPVKMIEISKDMDPQTQQFFWPLNGLLEKFMKVFEFQSKHKGMFLQSLFKKYTYAKKECIHYYNANKKLKQENEMLRSMLRSAGINPNQFLVTSTPMSEQNKTFDNNLSMLSSVRFTPRCGSAQRVSVGSARRVSNCPPKRQQLYQQNYIKGHSIISSESEGPSPAQTVPKGYPSFGYVAPVHREHSINNPAAAPPAFMEKLRRDAFMARSNPRK